MAVPAWFDPLLLVPRPRPLRAHPLIAGLRIFEACLGAAGLVSLFLPSIAAKVLGGVGLGTTLGILAVTEPIFRRERGLLRDGVAAIARVVPVVETAVDSGVRVLAAVGHAGRIGPKLGYEFPAGGGRVVRASRFLATLAATPGMFPGGTEVGARFAVLFDPRDPERNAPYRPGSMYRIRPSS